MKKRISLSLPVFLLLLILFLSNCTEYGFTPGSNEFLKKIKSGGYIIEEISYNQNNLISEVKSTTFYRKFHYNEKLQLVKEEVAASPDMLSSMAPVTQSHEFVNPVETGISMYHIYEYANNDNLVSQLNFIRQNGKLVYRSKWTFEYNDSNQISKVLLHDGKDEVTQFRTYLYDDNGNVKEEDYFTYLFIPEGTGPKHLNKTTYEYDSFFNPFIVFKLKGIPGMYTNLNNIVSYKSVNYEHTPGISDTTESTTSYEYNYETGFPVRIKNGEEYIYN